MMCPASVEPEMSKNNLTARPHGQGPRLMICDSFNEPGYEQSSCSHYISRNSCCFSGGFDFLLYPLLRSVAASWTSPSHTNKLNNNVEAAGREQAAVCDISGTGFSTYSHVHALLWPPKYIDTSLKTTSCIYAVVNNGFGGFNACN